MSQTRSPIEADDRLVPGDPRRPVRHRPAVDPRGVFCSRQGRMGRDGRARPAQVRRSRSCASSSSTRRRSNSSLPLLERYPNAKQLVWLQEEPENMGAWAFVEHRVWRVKERGYDLRHVARVESGSPATGSKTVHDQELADLMDETFRDL